MEELLDLICRNCSVTLHPDVLQLPGLFSESISSIVRQHRARFWTRYQSTTRSVRANFLAQPPLSLDLREDFGGWRPYYLSTCWSALIGFAHAGVDVGAPVDPNGRSMWEWAIENENELYLRNLIEFAETKGGDVPRISTPPDLVLQLLRCDRLHKETVVKYLRAVTRFAPFQPTQEYAAEAERRKMKRCTALFRIQVLQGPNAPTLEYENSPSLLSTQPLIHFCAARRVCLAELFEAGCDLTTQALAPR